MPLLRGIFLCPVAQVADCSLSGQSVCALWAVWEGRRIGRRWWSCGRPGRMCLGLPCSAGVCCLFGDGRCGWRPVGGGMRGRRAAGRRCPWRRAGRFRRYWAATMSATGCARPERASWRATRRRGSWSASLPTGCRFGTAAADGHLADTRTAQGGLCRRRLLFPRPREDASPAKGRASLRCCERDEQAMRAGRGVRRASLRSGRARRATLAPLRRGVPVHARGDPAPRWRRSVVGGKALDAQA